jgi:hypothetical protein
VIHPNGHGHVDDQAEARPAAYVDRDSRVRHLARAHSGFLISSTLGIQCRLSNAVVARSTLCCDEVTGGIIIECGLFDQVCVWDSPALYRVTASGGARVYGQAVVLGPLDLYGDMRILAGTWHRAPRYQHLGFCFLTEGPPGWAMVDCKFNSYEGWFCIGDRYARRYFGWTPDQLAQVRNVFTDWAATEDMRGKHWGRCVAGCPG